jgi:NAD(P)H-dependent FMN reductase
MTLQIAVILSSVRPGRLNERVAKFVKASLESKGAKVHIIDPTKYSLPLLQTPFFSPALPEGPLKQSLSEISSILKACDAFVVTSAEYNHSFPPALSNLMSYFRSEYHYKPSAICCYSMGPFGGVRAAMALRPFLAGICI